MIEPEFGTVVGMEEDPKSAEDGVGARVRRGCGGARKMSHAMLAGLVGYGEGALKNLEAGKTGAPNFANGLLMAEALGVSPIELALGPEWENDYRVKRLRAEGYLVLARPLTIERVDDDPARSHLQGDSLQEMLENLTQRVDMAFEEARRAQATADEAIRASARRGHKNG